MSRKKDMEKITETKLKNGRPAFMDFVQIVKLKCLGLAT